MEKQQQKHTSIIARNPTTQQQQKSKKKTQAQPFFCFCFCLKAHNQLIDFTRSHLRLCVCSKYPSQAEKKEEKFRYEQNNKPILYYTVLCI